MFSLKIFISEAFKCVGSKLVIINTDTCTFLET